MGAFIRTAMPADVKAISKLLGETWHATYDGLIGPAKVSEIIGQWHSEAALLRRFGMADAEFLVADTGMAIASTAFATQSGKTVAIHQLYVHPDHQRQGIGLELIREIAGCFIGANRIEAEVASRNAPALAFYIANGFSTGGRQPVPEPQTGLDHIRLALDIPEEKRWQAL